MNKNARITGMITAACILFLTLAFIILAAVFPPQEYGTEEQFLAGSGRTLIFPVIPSLLLVLANIPFLTSLFFYAGESARPLALTGLLFGVAYAVCGGINYFLQLTVVPRGILSGDTGLIAVTCMHIKGSPAMALDNLGYAFLSLGFLFFSGIFTLKGLQGYIKTALGH